MKLKYDLFQLWFWTQVREFARWLINVFCWAYSWFLTTEIYRRHRFDKTKISKRDVFAHVHPVYKMLLWSFMNDKITYKQYLKHREDIRHA